MNQDHSRQSNQGSRSDEYGHQQMGGRSPPPETSPYQGPQGQVPTDRPPQGGPSPQQGRYEQGQPGSGQQFGRQGGPEQAPQGYGQGQQPQYEPQGGPGRQQQQQGLGHGQGFGPQQGRFDPYGQQGAPGGQPTQVSTPAGQEQQYGQQAEQSPGIQSGPSGGIPPQQWHQPPQQQAGQVPAPQQFTQQPGAQGQPVAGARRAGPRLRPVGVEEIVETDVVTAEGDASLATLAELLAEEDVGSVVVVEDDRPVGIVTDRSLALTLRSPSELTEMTARDLVHGDLVTGTTDMSVFDVLQRLEEAEIRRLPIVDEDGTLEGIVTLDDVLVLLGTELHNAAEIIKAQSPRL